MLGFPRYGHKYALENGNERARLHIKAHFPNLKESTIRNFKKAYKEQLKKKALVTALPTMPRGRPPLLMELDKKLRFLNAMRARGGVIVMLSEQQQMLLFEATIHLACSTFETSPCLVYGFNKSTSEWATPEQWEQLDLLFPRDYMMSAEFLPS